MGNIKTKAAELVAQMTREEKVSQMMHAAKGVERLGIPEYNWWNEALHGVARAGTATVFPQAIALAATFDESLIEQIADVISTEARAKYNANQAEGDRDIYKGLTFWSPNINIFRDPRWGRGHETYGEDPYLTSRMGAAFIRGLQGIGNDKNHLKVAACAKHFAVHSGPELDRHRFDAVVNDYDLWNTYLYAFEVAVTEAGVEAVMGAYNRTNGEPCCGSKRLLVDILRDKWHFDGHVTSDCWAIKDFHEHHRVTASPVESVALAIKNGCDVNCGVAFSLALPAMESGLLTEAQIDTAVTRLMTTRLRLGQLTDEHNDYDDIPYTVVDCDEHAELNLEAARRSIVLLKNDGALPLPSQSPTKNDGISPSMQTLGVIGPNADSVLALEGNYQGTASRYVTVLDGIREIADTRGVRVLYSEGCDLTQEKTGLAAADNRFGEARTVAKHSDVIVVVLGLNGRVEGEEGDAYADSIAGDKPNIALPGRQEALLKTVIDAANGKPVIAMIISGSAVASEWASAHVNALLQVFYPGALGGKAAAQALFGDFSPSGKLPVTIYKNAADLPDFTDYAMADGIGRTYRYFKGEALYPFGFGLSYVPSAQWGLRALSATKTSVTVTVTNKSRICARETLQVYVTSPDTKEVRTLCGIYNIALDAAAGEHEKTVTVALSKTAFSRYDERGDMHEIKGTHTLSVGFTQNDERSVQLYGSAPLTTEVVV
ncbi:MAG: glycoside hydrolase family 3 C-terminal domain-containing protein [Treponemataceae bacterium]|nr:MAG: glycoside hydrolase family 3 C-terminal domain-containing protein [Treponemataceae bacterium]